MLPGLSGLEVMEELRGDERDVSYCGVDADRPS